MGSESDWLQVSLFHYHLALYVQSFNDGRWHVLRGQNEKQKVYDND